MLPDHYIITVDLDSTLADTTHRAHMLLEDGTNDWDAYSQACSGDAVLAGVATLVRILSSLGAEVYALSGRKVSANSHTIEWLQRHEIPISRVYLDDSDCGDYDNPFDHATYKLSKLREIECSMGADVVLHIDDWPLVHKVFEESGIPTICVKAPFEIRKVLDGIPLG